jgi:hypothetical protein
MSSENTCRLDSWWLEKRWRDQRITARGARALGQFAGQDFYGAQHFAASFIFEPMGYALGNLFTTRESFDPPSTPALRAQALRHPINLGGASLPRQAGAGRMTILWEFDEKHPKQVRACGVPATYLAHPIEEAPANG